MSRRKTADRKGISLAPLLAQKCKTPALLDFCALAFFPCPEGHDAKKAVSHLMQCLSINDKCRTKKNAVAKQANGVVDIQVRP